MSELILRKEARGILKQMKVIENKQNYLCSVVRVLKLRHQNIDIVQTTKVVKEILND